MKTKKIIALVVAILMSISLVACSSDSSDKEEAKKASKTIDVKRGEWEGNTFKNKSSNLQFTIDESMHAYTYEQLKEEFKFVDEKVNENTEKDISVDETKTIYDCKFLTDKIGSNIIIEYVKLSKTERHLPIKTFLEAVSVEINNIDNCDCEIKERSTATIAGDKYTMYVADVNFYGSKCTQKYYAKKVGNVVIYFVSTIFGEDSTINDNMINSISHIK